jgi:hypothetical protein
MLIFTTYRKCFSKQKCTHKDKNLLWYDAIQVSISGAWCFQNTVPTYHCTRYHIPVDCAINTTVKTWHLTDVYARNRPRVKFLMKYLTHPNGQMPPKPSNYAIRWWKCFRFKNFKPFVCSVIKHNKLLSLSFRQCVKTYWYFSDKVAMSELHPTFTVWSIFQSTACYMYSFTTKN